MGDPIGLVTRRLSRKQPIQIDIKERPELFAELDQLLRQKLLQLEPAAEKEPVEAD